jgi:hypothetical protein
MEVKNKKLASAPNYSTKKNTNALPKGMFGSLGIAYSKAEKPVVLAPIYLVSLASIRGSLLVNNDVRSVDSKLPKKKICGKENGHVMEITQSQKVDKHNRIHMFAFLQQLRS